VAKRSVDGQDLLYQSLKLANGIWCLIELTPDLANASLQVILDFLALATCKNLFKLYILSKWSETK